MNKKLKTVFFAVCAALLCLKLGQLFFDGVIILWIDRIYHGRSVGFLNCIFSNRQNHSLEYYDDKCRGIFYYLLTFFLIATSLCVINEFGPKKAVLAVRKFFEAKAHPVDLAVFRIVFFISAIFLMILSRCLWFSGLPSELIVPPAGLGWLLRWMPVNPAPVSVFAVVYLFFCLTGALGLFSRTSAWIVCISGFYVLGIPQFYGKVNHYHYLLWFSAILGSSPCGDALSCDALIQAWKQTRDGHYRPLGASRAYGVPLRFIWILFGIMYFFPGFWKLLSGPEWTLGDNLKYMMYSKWVELGGWMPIFRIDHYPLVCKFSALGAVVFELSFLFLIFSDRLRPLAVIGGILFHNLTNLMMKIPFFEIQVLYVVFFDWHSVFTRIGRRLFKQEMIVLYDGNCRLCRGTMASLAVFDILGRVTYVNALDAQEVQRRGLDWLSPQALLVDMHVVVGRRVWKGYESYRVLVSRIPLFWPLLPLFWIWPVPWFGRRIYRQVADSRSCAITRSVPESTAGLPKLRPLFVVGTLLVVVNIFCGFGKILKAWPFACYPTFDGLVKGEKTSLSIEVQADDGTVIAGGLDSLIEKFSSERFGGLIEYNLSIQDENEKKVRLEALWKVCVENNSELKHASVVRFYNETLATAPERWHENPLKRQLIYEMSVKK